MNDEEQQRLQELETVMREEESKVGSSSGSNRGSPAAVSNDRKTAAEKRFEEAQKKRVCWNDLCCGSHQFTQSF